MHRNVQQGLASRKAAIAKYNLLDELGTANVSKVRPLKVGRDAGHNIGDKQGGSGYGFVIFEGKIMLARGMLQKFVRSFQIPLTQYTFQCFRSTQNREVRTESIAGQAKHPASRQFHTRRFNSSNILPADTSVPSRRP